MSHAKFFFLKINNFIDKKLLNYIMKNLNKFMSHYCYQPC